MPVYEYDCPVHGRFEKYSQIPGQIPRVCSQCGEEAQQIIARLAKHVFKERPRLRLGSGEPNRLVKQVDDKPGFLIMSEGLLEKSEMDYIEDAQRDKLQTYERKTQKRKVSIASEKKNYEVEVKEI